jgi:hypothetical protein
MVESAVTGFAAADIDIAQPDVPVRIPSASRAEQAGRAATKAEAQTRSRRRAQAEIKSVDVGERRSREVPKDEVGQARSARLASRETARRRRHRRRSWQAEAASATWQRTVAGSALIAVSGTIGLASIKGIGLGLPGWGSPPAAEHIQAVTQAETVSALAVFTRSGTASPLDVPLSGKALDAPAEGQARPPHPHPKPGVTNSVAAAKEYAQAGLLSRGWAGSNEMTCLDRLWTRESGWRADAMNPSSGAYGIPQSLPATKMASAGSDWRVNAETQIDWGLNYIRSVYGSPCQAWAHSEATGWY